MPASHNKPEWLDNRNNLVSGNRGVSSCDNIQDISSNNRPRNFFAYLLASVFTKIADELCSARLIFPWLIGAVGAPTVFAGFLVPIREAGVLLPQLLVAAHIHHLAIRKWVWVLGGLLSAFTIALVIPGIQAVSGIAAGWLIISLLMLYSLSRGICSVSAKDVMGKTVPKTRRGTLMGLSAGISGFATLGIGLFIQLKNPHNSDTAFFAFLLAGAVIAYLISVVFFATIDEPPGKTEPGGDILFSALRSTRLVVTDKVFRQFLIARILLLAIALAPPFYVLLAQQQAINLAGLGILIVASGLASMLSAPIWGKMSDHSSRGVMALTSLLTGIMGILVFAANELNSYPFDNKWEITGLFFLIAVFHGGARLGRKTYLVDMATVDNRSTYVAVSNTLIGVVMLAAGAVGVLGDIFSIATVIGVLGIISLLSTLYLWRLKGVSGASHS